MKKIVVLALGIAYVFASVGIIVYLAAPDGKPAQPVYVQRAVQLLEASNAGRWQDACDAAPTAAYGLEDFVQIALMYGVHSPADVPRFCRELIKGAGTGKDAKTPVGLKWKILWFTPKDVPGEKLVIVRMQWGGEQPRTVTLHMALARIPWLKETATCQGKPCPPMRWYVLGAN